MRNTTRLFLLLLVSAHAGNSMLGAQAAPTRQAEAVDTVRASMRWNRLIPKFAAEAVASRRAARAAAAGDSAALRRIAQTPPPMLFSVYTLLSLAQHAAANSVTNEPKVSSRAAIAGASAAVLAHLFADSAVRASIERELARDMKIMGTNSLDSAGVTAGSRMGADVARRVMAWAPTLNMVEPWNGTMPTGPGMWYGARGVPPLGIAAAKARPWLLDSASQFRPAPPPAYGSPAFKAAQEEVRRVARERTAEQTKIAQRWNSADPWALWNETAVTALRRRGASDAEDARVLAVMNVAASDAILACFAAKYHHWTIRPSQADSTLVLADSVSLPNFPSYPSGHACSAGAFEAVLVHFFPQDRAAFVRIAEEQAMSRLFGGVHFRFDNDEGLALGRAVGRYAVEQETRGKLGVARIAPTVSRP